MPTTPLLLRASSARLWERFQAGKALRRPDEGSEAVVLRWRRARALRADPGGSGLGGEPRILGARELEERRSRAGHLWSEGEQLLEELAEQVTTPNRRLALADADGVVLRALGGGRFGREAEAMGVVEGGRWSEGICGTNAIGTSLIEARPVAVEGVAHSERALHRLAGYGCPVVDARGELVGALGLFALLKDGAATLHGQIIAATRVLEHRVRSRQDALEEAAQVAQLEAIVRRCPAAALFLDQRAGVRVVNEAARRLLGVTPSQVACLPLTDLLGIGWNELASNAAHPDVEAVLQLPDRGPSGSGSPVTALLRVEAVRDRQGRTRGLLAFVEPRRRSPRPAVSGPGPSRASRALDDPFATIFGRDARLLAAVEAADRFAPTTLPVLLLAETGTGKDLFARAIHRASPRSERAFVPINCGALSPHLLETELFGYEAGAFTGASRGGRDGKIASASGGTLFLDEVAEMPAPLQAALLRVLEDGTYYRVGGNESRQADVRLICATCRDLRHLVEEGCFRRDLYYRIKGACLRLPPLRGRDDIAELAVFLLQQLTDELFPGTRPRIAPEVLEWIGRNPWPGNVRELRTALHHAAILARGEIRMEHLPADLLEPPGEIGLEPFPPPGSASPPAPARPLRDVESATLRRAIERAGGNISRAAEQLGIARSTLYRKMKRYGLEVG